MKYKEFIHSILFEDLKDEGDHTSLSTIPAEAESKARLLVKGDGVLAGLDLAVEIFKFVDPDLKLELFMKDGDEIKFGDIAFHVIGKSQSILKAERVVLNMMQRMSGIASMARTYVNETKHTGAKILDTRKTTPLLRYFEKWAVKIGGAHNHRFGLYDMMMIKDNHVDYAGGISAAIERANAYKKEKNLDIKIEIEVRNEDELNQVLESGNVDRIMLDNFTPERIIEVLPLIDTDKYETEASGGITLKTVKAYAETGVEYISVGALTHSVKSLDLSLKAF